MDITYGEIVVDAEQGVTQGALATYYGAVATAMLPHIVDRPLSVVRRGKTEPHGAIADERGLIALVEEFAPEIQAVAAHSSDLGHPDRLVFELEPGDNVPFGEVARAAKVIRAGFHGLDLEAFAMTRGPRGLDVMVPVRPELDWDGVRRFAALVAEALVAAAPERYASSIDSEARNRVRVSTVAAPGSTFVVPYSTQLLSNAQVALPAFWYELEELAPETLTPDEVVERLRTLPSDPWERAVGLDQRLTAERRTSLVVALKRALDAGG